MYALHSCDPQDRNSPIYTEWREIESQLAQEKTFSPQETWMLERL
jgi:hypothetical protein